MGHPHVLDQDKVTEVEPHKLVTDASEQHIPPDMIWPKLISGRGLGNRGLGNGEDFVLSAWAPNRALYHQVHGSLELVIFND